jgi:hypothetical protein
MICFKDSVDKIEKTNIKSLQIISFLSFSLRTRYFKYQEKNQRYKL